MPSFGELITGQRAHLARGSEQLCRTQRLSARITCPLAPTLAADCASLRASQQKGTYHAGTLFPKLPNPSGTRGLRAVSINIPCPGTWMPQPASALLPRPAEPQILPVNSCFMCTGRQNILYATHKKNKLRPQGTIYPSGLS